MKFKIDTTNKTITLLGKVSYKELAEFMFDFVGENSGDWQVDFEPEFFSAPIITPIIVEPWPYIPTYPSYPPTNPIWHTTGDTGEKPDVLPLTTCYEYSGTGSSN